MGTPSKYTSKIIFVFCIAVPFLNPNIASSDTLPTKEAINRLAENAKLTANTFMQQSFTIRMQYEYSGKFLTENDKENLYKLAKNAGDTLQTIIENQETLKQQIEDYQGDDWDQRYGSTGLWRKLAADIYITKLNKFEIDYYLALTSDQQRQSRKLRSILGEIDTLIQTGRQSSPNLTRGKTLALLSQTKPSYKNAAIREFEELADYSDIYYSATALINKMKLLHEVDTNKLNTLVKKLRSNWNDKYLELILSLMFLQRQYDLQDLEKTLSLWPETEDLIAPFVLSDLSYQLEKQQNLQQLSILEAELAALAAWKNEAKSHKKLLKRLLNTEKFQTPLILYVTAVALAESSPAEAVNLLVKTSKLQHQQKNIRLNIDSGKIARQAALLAYNIFVTESNCPLALESFENYCTIVGEKTDEELEYLYTVVLNSCGRNTKAKELLEKIAGRPAGNLRNRARLDLILHEMQSNPQRRNEPLEKLSEFILSCRGRDKKTNELRTEAINLYCQAALESKDKASAEKVLEILTNAETTAGINLDLFKAQALQQLGRLDESAHYMLSAIHDDSGSLAGEAWELLAEAIDKIDEFETEPNNPYSLEMMKNCKKLAQFTHSSLNDQQSALFLAEISIFAADKNREKLSEVDTLLKNLAADVGENDADFLRCRARLFCERTEFDKSASLWAKIAEIQKNTPMQTNQRSRKWWRAKYYELYCLSQYPQMKKEEIVHTIEVLENSFANIPPFWAEKLNSLKHLCRSNLSRGK